MLRKRIISRLASTMLPFLSLGERSADVRIEKRINLLTVSEFYGVIFNNILYFISDKRPPLDGGIGLSIHFKKEVFEV